MMNTLPSQNVSLLKSHLGKTITSVKRQVFKDDMDCDEYEQKADGPVEVRFDDNSVIHFMVKTETDSLGVTASEMPPYGDSYTFIDVSHSSFWRERIGQNITKMVFLQASDWSEEYPSEFGVELSFHNGKKALIQYLNKEDSPDMMNVTDHYTGQPCITKLIE